MAYPYETPKKELMWEILNAAYQDRSSLSAAVHGSDLEADIETAEECDRLCRDIIRMDHNLKLGVFHENTVKTLNDDPD